MATGQKTIVIEDKIETKRVAVEKISLILSKDEAQAVQDLFSFVGGAPTSRRKYIDAVSVAILDAGVSMNMRVLDIVSLAGVSFKTLPQIPVPTPTPFNDMFHRSF